MIITRSPLRISLGGGGTDLPSYYREHGGFLVAAAIDKYVYVTFQSTYMYGRDILVRYSKIERTPDVESIQHPIIREALLLLGIRDRNLEMTSMADIPAGTGLGSSGSFATAFIKAAQKYRNRHITQEDLARLACHVEIDLLREPVGKQDQYIAAFGGLTVFEFLPDDQVKVRPLHISSDVLYNLEDHLLLFATGMARSASSILKEQDDKSREGNQVMVQNLHFVKELGIESCKMLESGNLLEFGRLMNTHWEYKKKRSKAMSNGEIDAWYELAMAHGAVGGKLIGAGGGGFLMFYTEDPTTLRKTMRGAGLTELRFAFDFEGTKVL